MVILFTVIIMVECSLLINNIKLRKITHHESHTLVLSISHQLGRGVAKPPAPVHILMDISAHNGAEITNRNNAALPLMNNFEF